jgi:hypothetical protein
MSPQLHTYEFHPELGYLCPSRQLRQNVRVGLAAAAFGLIAGVGGAMALLPRHSDDVVWTEPSLTAAPADSASRSTLTVGSGSFAPVVTLDTAKRVPADGVAKPLPTARTAGLGIASDAASPSVEIPAQVAPLVTPDRTAAEKGTEQRRAVSSKRAKTASSSGRRRAREPAPLDSFANRPRGFQLGPFAYDTRFGRRRDEGNGWSW